MLRIVSILCLLFMISCSHSVKRETTQMKDYYEKINGTELHFHVKTHNSQTPYILFLNGGPGDSSVHGRAILETLNWNGNIIFLDQRGCGKSSREVAKDSFTFKNLIKDIDGVLDKLQLNEVILLGHSWGGVYGAHYALARPQKVKGLIMVDTLVSWDGALKNYYSHTHLYSERMINLFQKIKEERGLDLVEENEVKRHIGFLNSFYEKKSPGDLNPYNLNVDINEIPYNNLDAILKELKDDNIAIGKFKNNDNPWKGWNARNIRRKYPLHSYHYEQNDIAKKSNELSKNLYDKNEIAYSKLMEEGLHVNKDWGANFDLMEVIKNIKIPIYYLYGKHDILFKSKSLASAISKRYSHKNVIVFEKSGHTPFSESPEEFQQIMNDIYSQLSKN